MDESYFHEQADRLLEALEEAIELENTEGKAEPELLDGVLTIALEEGGEIVLNKHAPTLQIWMASPLSGASYWRYNEDEDSWYNDSSERLVDRVADELRELADISIEL